MWRGLASFQTQNVPQSLSTHGIMILSLPLSEDMQIVGIDEHRMTNFAEQQGCVYALSLIRSSPRRASLWMNCLLPAFLVVPHAVRGLLLPHLIPLDDLML